MADEPTLGELDRRMVAMHADLKEDIGQLGTRLDGKLSSDVAELRMKALERDIAAANARTAELEAELAQRDRQRGADRRLLVTALVAPLLLWLVQVYASTRGAGA